MLPLLRTHNRLRMARIRDQAPNAVEALARMVEDSQIIDDGTPRGRVDVILMASEHAIIPGLHTGLNIGLTGFRKEYEDPWPTSTDQVGHFLTAVRLCIDPGFLFISPIPLLLGGWGDRDIPLRLIIGHEKAPDPPDVDKRNIQTLLSVLRHFRAQYHSVQEEDIENFKTGNLQAISLGNGLGNSMADLALSYQGWVFGLKLKEGAFPTRQSVADWVRSVLGNPV